MQEIDYKLLKDGHPGEVRFVLGQVIMDTMSEELPRVSTEYDQLNMEASEDDLADGSRPSLSTLFSSKSWWLSRSHSTKISQDLSIPWFHNQRAQRIEVLGRAGWSVGHHTMQANFYRS